MKVKIGKYPNRLTSRIHTRYMDNKYGFDWPEDCNYTRFENFLAKVEDGIQACYSPINFFLDKRQRKVSVRIDPEDTYNMDQTLAYIILPMLKQLKEQKHGAPSVEMTDVPPHLRNNDPESKSFWMSDETDEKFFDRWEWVLDEMIHSFESKYHDDDPLFDETITKEQAKKNWDRISNGFRLFGKYYENLWD